MNLLIYLKMIEKNFLGLLQMKPKVSSNGFWPNVFSM